MGYNIDQFVNVHSPKLGRLVADVQQQAFETAVVYDAVDDEAWPVLVYTLRGNPVAWYDLEQSAGIVV
jgi:hypothetical protein